MWGRQLSRTMLDKFKKVKAFVFDVDGVFTTGEILVTETGEQLRVFNVKDGYALQYAVKAGYPVLVVTGGRSQGVRIRFEKLGVKDVYLDVANKSEVVEKWLTEQSISMEDVLIMGDDLPDLAILEKAGVSCCPADAVHQVKAVCDYISGKEGGKGAVREIIEKVLGLQKVWTADVQIKSK